MRDWQEISLGELSDITSSKRIFYSDYVNEGIPFWRSKEVIEKFNKKEISTDLFISKEKYFDIKNRFGVPRPNDILLTSVGTLGIPYLVEDEGHFYFKDGNLTWIRNIDVERLSPRYLYKWLASGYGRETLREITIGSTQEALTILGLKNLKLLLPSLPEQKAIAAVLSSLDDKIDLLHRQNQTLEALAATLFRQWFVEEAREDWEEGKIGDLFVLQRGFDLPAPDRIIGKYPIYAASGYSGTHLEYKVKGPGVTTGRSGLLGKVFFVIEDFWPLNTSLYVKEFKRGTPLFAYFFLTAMDLDAFNAGSAVPTLNRNHVHQEKTMLPPIELIARFEQIANSKYQKIKQNELQIKTLETLRDTLLPKLMNGEVRVALNKEDKVAA